RPLWPPGTRTVGDTTESSAPPYVQSGPDGWPPETFRSGYIFCVLRATKDLPCLWIAAAIRGPIIQIGRWPSGTGAGLTAGGRCSISLGGRFPNVIHAAMLRQS